MKRGKTLARLALVAVGATCVVLVVAVALPPLTAHPVYSVSQITAGLDPHHNVWAGRTVWVRGVAILGQDVGTLPNDVELFDRAPPGNTDGFKVVVTQPNLTFTLLSWRAAIAHTMLGMGWLYGRKPGMYRVRFFRPAGVTRWCMSCPAGQLASP